jgi:hypothetical protein
MKEQPITETAYTDGDFTALNHRLIKATMDRTNIDFAINEATLNMVTGIEYAPFGDENFAEKMLIKVLRTLRVSSFNQHKKSVSDYEETIKSIGSEAYKLISNQSGVIEQIIHSEYLHAIHADEHTSLSNHEWGENMSKAFEGLNTYLDEIDHAVNQIEKVLDFIAQLNGYSPLLLRKSSVL